MEEVFSDLEDSDQYNEAENIFSHPLRIKSIDDALFFNEHIGKDNKDNKTHLKRKVVTLVDKKEENLLKAYEDIPVFQSRLNIESQSRLQYLLDLYWKNAKNAGEVYENEIKTYVETSEKKRIYDLKLKLKRQLYSTLIFSNDRNDFSGVKIGFNIKLSSSIQQKLSQSSKKHLVSSQFTSVNSISRQSNVVYNTGRYENLKLKIKPCLQDVSDFDKVQNQIYTSQSLQRLLEYHPSTTIQTLSKLKNLTVPMMVKITIIRRKFGKDILFVLDLTGLKEQQKNNQRIILNQTDLFKYGVYTNLFIDPDQNENKPGLIQQVESLILSRMKKIRIKMYSRFVFTNTTPQTKNNTKKSIIGQDWYHKDNKLFRKQCSEMNVKINTKNLNFTQNDQKNTYKGDIEVLKFNAVDNEDAKDNLKRIGNRRQSVAFDPKLFDKNLFKIEDRLDNTKKNQYFKGLNNSSIFLGKMKSMSIERDVTRKRSVAQENHNFEEYWVTNCESLKEVYEQSKLKISLIKKTQKIKKQLNFINFDMINFCNSRNQYKYTEHFKNGKGDATNLQKNNKNIHNDKIHRMNPRIYETHITEEAQNSNTSLRTKSKARNTKNEILYIHSDSEKTEKSTNTLKKQNFNEESCVETSKVSSNLQNEKIKNIFENNRLKSYDQTSQDTSSINSQTNMCPSIPEIYDSNYETNNRSFSANLSKNQSSQSQISANDKKNMLQSTLYNKKLVKSKFLRLKNNNKLAVANLYILNDTNQVEIEVYVPSTVETYYTCINKTQLGLFSPKIFQKLQKLRGVQAQKLKTRFSAINRDNA